MIRNDSLDDKTTPAIDRMGEIAFRTHLEEVYQEALRTSFSLDKINRIIESPSVCEDSNRLATALVFRARIHLRAMDQEAGRKDLDEASSLSHNSDAWLKATILYNQSCASIYDEPELSLRLSLKALSIFEEIGDGDMVATVQDQLSGAYLHLGDESTAIHYCTLALQFYSPDDPDRVFPLATMANILSISGDEQGSLQLYKECRKISERASNMLGVQLLDLNIASQYLSIGDFRQVKEVSEAGYQKSMEMKLPKHAAAFRSILAHLYFEEGNYEDSFDIFQDELRLDPVRKWDTILAIINCEIKLGKLESAKEAIDNAAGEIHANKLSECTDGPYAQYYAAIGDWKQAYEHEKLCRAFHDKRTNGEHINKLNSTRILLAIEREKHETQLQQLRAAQLEKDLSTRAMFTAQQTELISNFREDLRRILRKIEVRDPAINELRAKLTELPEGVDWRAFDEQFQQVHPQFRAQLEEKFPDLTSQESRICVLLRLNLNSRDISKLIGLSKRTIENHRYNIRGKLGLKPEEDIAKFLGKI